jgi:hypothetical protein
VSVPTADQQAPGGEQHGRQRIDGHVQNTRDFRGPRFAIDPECDWDLE